MHRGQRSGRGLDQERIRSLHLKELLGLGAAHVDHVTAHQVIHRKARDTELLGAVASFNRDVVAHAKTGMVGQHGADDTTRLSSSRRTALESP